MTTELDSAVSSFWLSSAALSYISEVFPAEQTSWPYWQTLMACSKADALVGNKRFFTCGTLETSDSKVL